MIEGLVARASELGTPSLSDLPGGRRLWLVVVALVLTSGGLTFAHEPPQLEPGTVDSPANGTTVVTAQGWNAAGRSLADRPSRLVALDPNGVPKWEHDGPPDRRNWFYDVDPLPNGNLLVVNPVSDETVVYEFDPETRERRWTERLPHRDIHDVDLIDGTDLLVAGINYTEGRPAGDRVYVYNRTREEVTWEWYFRNHYPADAGPGSASGDWTHVNDVDAVGNGSVLVSVRNLDQVILVNRSTKAIELRLGRDGAYDILDEQHNPTYLESRDGDPTILVADSENDRIVEYEYAGGENGEWERVWSLSGGLNWPRDADRLPNGNTLVVDSMHHRVIEVTPRGEIVWEAVVPWATYDAERVVHGDEPGGPTMRDLDAGGAYELQPDTPSHVTLPTVPQVIEDVRSVVPIPDSLQHLVRRWNHVAPWFTPLWLPTWSASLLAVALSILLGAGVTRGLRRSERVRRVAGRVRAGLSGRDRG
jgi:outer membrane protein assembly factor BamB